MEDKQDGKHPLGGKLQVIKPGRRKTRKEKKAERKKDPLGPAHPLIVECNSMDRLLELQTQLLFLSQFNGVPAHEFIYKALNQAIAGLSFVSINTQGRSFAQMHTDCRDAVFNEYRRVPPGEFIAAVSDILFARQAKVLAHRGAKKINDKAGDKPPANDSGPGTIAKNDPDSGPGEDK